ncbi:IS3 family transposase [Endozoicomonas sp. SCSIO W0465]|uniref:IS3 family transposase n=1 Tax=Endozoicomonas sp. SCSIO W0465 TaxID=2918516 RepID=UPI002074CDD0|nr:IS3 family transposase [Endozoicomonas sp. SCSIO W0465]USE37246.1 IS3 family transposase [Endozoicomonas sp. SCSIO W0465]
MQVGRSGFYRWQNQQEHQKDSLAKQFRLDSDAQQIFIDSDRSYGSRRMAKALQGKGYNIGRYQAATLMKRLGLVVKYAKKFKVTTMRILVNLNTYSVSFEHPELLTHCPV